MNKTKPGPLALAVTWILVIAVAALVFAGGAQMISNAGAAPEQTISSQLDQAAINACDQVYYSIRGYGLGHDAEAKQDLVISYRAAIEGSSNQLLQETGPVLERASIYGYESWKLGLDTAIIRCQDAGYQFGDLEG